MTARPSAANSLRGECLWFHISTSHLCPNPRRGLKARDHDLGITWRQGRSRGALARVYPLVAKLGLQGQSTHGATGLKSSTAARVAGKRIRTKAVWWPPESTPVL